MTGDALPQYGALPQYVSLPSWRELPPAARPPA